MESSFNLSNNITNPLLDRPCTQIPYPYENFSSFCEAQHYQLVYNVQIYMYAILLFSFLLNVLTWIVSENVKALSSASGMAEDDILSYSIAVNKLSGFIPLVYVIYQTVFSYNAIIPQYKTMIYVLMGIGVLVYTINIITYYAKRKNDNKDK